MIKVRAIATLMQIKYQVGRVELRIMVTWYKKHCKMAIWKVLWSILSYLNDRDESGEKMGVFSKDV